MSRAPSPHEQRLSDAGPSPSPPQPPPDAHGQYGSFFRLSSDGIWRFDLDHPIRVDLPHDEQIRLMFRDGYLGECNDAFARMYGFSCASDLTGRRLREFHPEDDPRSRDLLQAFIANGYRLDDAESTEPDRHGNVHVFLNSFVGVVENGTILRAWGTQRDVTAQRRAEADARQLAAMVRSSRDAILSVALDGTILTWNRGAEQMFGYASHEAVGQPITILAPPDHPGDPRHLLEHVQSHGPVSGFETVRARKGGSLVEVAISIDPVFDAAGRVVALAGVIRDITDRKRAERAVAESEQRLRLGLSAGNVGTWDWDIRTNKVIWSDRLYEFHGLKPGEFGGTVEDFAGIIHPQDAIRVDTALRAALEGGDPYQIDFRTVRPGGEVRWLSTTGQVLFEDGRPVRMLGATIDITNRKRAEDALRDSERRLRLAQNAARLGTWELDFDTGRAEWSEGIWHLLGLAPDEAPTTWERWNTFVHPDDRDGALAAFNRQVESGSREFYLEFRIINAQRGVRWVASKGQLLLDEAGKPLRALGANHDITERKHAEEALRETVERYRLAARATNDAIWDWDLVSDKVYWNQAVQSLFGHAIFDAPSSGAWWKEHLHPDDRDRVVHGIEQVIGGTANRWEAEYRFRRADGSYADVLDRGYTLRDQTGASIRMIGAIMDLTERKRAEAERERLLDSERFARGEAERASRIKDEFLATLSHELRTPLNAILGWSQIIRRGQGGSVLPSNVAEGLAVIERNARAQAQIIEDLLDMSRIASGKVRLDVQTCDLAEVVRAAVETVHPSAQAKGLRVDVALGRHSIRVSADVDRLQQVFWNLLTNAVKFTPAAGSIAVRVEQGDREVCVRVIDSGEGISEDFLPYVFEHFRQADGSTTRRHGGLGLGLAIVKRLVELHGGLVRAESEGVGLGSTFTVTLPLARPATEPGAADAQLGPLPATPGSADLMARLAGVRVLIVDDDADARGLVERLLGGHRAATRTAATAADAIVAFTAEPPDVLVCDISMPGEDGYSLMRRIRALPPAAGGNVPAIALTAYARYEDRMRSLQAGFQTHVAKPVDPDELAAVIANLARPQGP